MTYVIKCVTIFVDGLPVLTQVKTYSDIETREAVNLDPDKELAFEGTPEDALNISSGWSFYEGQRYVSCQSNQYAWERSADWWKTT